ncbi:F-box only protein 42 [Ahaetulla prasina]|uniref:F-box only protein 42 n=1 Tax=Ahaetulla prasina TaxID=499056 RepID=UPI002647E212|nr:F-box only protein 42 [Ahaetulla prasina]XP_058017403.1 F-box only protein 42 [Ahaetulla prasina]XP_058017404.1 F-box only protein 42 [Ahaetulla prasina]
MANSESDDDSFMAVDSEEAVAEGTMDQEDGVCAARPEEEEEEEGGARPHRSMQELPEEVLEYILSFLSPYQEHKTAALVCKQWYRLIKGVAHQCYHGFIKSVQEGNIQWESRTYPYPGTPITQRFSHSACYYDANQSMYVFGGCTQSSCNAAFNDLWRLDLNSKEWIRPLASGSYPSPKAGATLAVYKDLLVLFGGWTRPSPYPLHQPERFFDEIHTYSPSKNWWNCVVTTHGPPPMAGHSSCVIQDRMIVFGGSLGSRQMSSDVWVLDLEHWTWSKPNISGPGPHPRGGQSQIVIDDETILVLGGCGGPNALFKDAWLLHMRSDRPWVWQPLKVENEDHGAPELWCHPACKVGQCVVVFSQAPSGRAPLSPSLNSRPSPISATPPALLPETRECRSQSPVRTADEAPCVNGRWGTLRPRGQRQTPCGSREGSLSPARDDSSPVLNGSEALSPGIAAVAAVGGASPDSPLQLLSPSAASVAEGYELKAGLSLAPRRGSLPDQKDLRLAAVDLNWEAKPPSLVCQPDGAESRTVGTIGLRNPPDQTNGIHTPPHVSSSLMGAVSPSALRRSLEAVQALSSKALPTLAVRSPPRASSPGSPSSQSSANPAEAAVPATVRPSSAQGDGHALPPIARRLGHHPPQSLNVGKPLYQSVNCKPMQMYVLDVKEVKGRGRVQWKVFHGSSVVGPPETSLHTVVQGRGEVIIFGGLMDKKQNVKYYPKTNALYFVRAKR